jgi:hypothetical protein
LRDAAAAIARRGLQQAAESVRLQAAMDRAGVCCLVLKGVAVERLAWRRIGVKQAWDIDLLVEAGEVSAAAVVLGGLGYANAMPGRLDEDAWRLWIAHAKEAEWVHAVNGLVVELHWRLTDTATLLPGLTARSPGLAVAIADGSPLAVRTLAPAETYAYLCIHGASHGWRRLKWLADVDALLAPLGTAQRLDLHARAVTLGAGRCSIVAQALCERLFGLAPPPAIAAAARRDRRARILAWLALTAIRSGGSGDIAEQPLLRDAILVSQLLFGDGVAFVASELRRQWVGLDDRLAVPLPPALGALYHLARIPSWAWRRMRRSGQTRARAPMVKGPR